MDFLQVLMKTLHEDHSTSLSHCAKEAYNQGLGPHHPWVVRQVAKVAMVACPSRETFITGTGGTYDDILFIKESVEKIKTPLWMFYEKRSIDKLE